MQGFDSVRGMAQCRIVSAALDSAVNKLSSCCDIMKLEIVDDLTATCWVYRMDLPMLQKIDEKITVIERTGLYWSVTQLCKRPVLIFGILVLLFSIFYLPTRVLFISVHGNNSLSDLAILGVAQECGVYFGATRKNIRSEKVKNTLLQNLPKLQWACINTKGCVAEIFVQERTTNKSDFEAASADIIAANDGIITDMVVYKGTPLCKVGQVVKKGQVLVSGYSDLGLLIKEETANAEIMAETTRSVVAVTPLKYLKKDRCAGITNRYGLLVGKKLIKFNKGSGISPPGCGRINEIYSLTLPGGFQLPFSVVIEQTYYYQNADPYNDRTASFEWLVNAANSYVCDQMIAGEIIKTTVTIDCSETTCSLRGYYRCNEMIAISQKKEIFLNGKRN